MNKKLFFEFKGERNYVQAGDIFNSLDAFAFGNGWYVRSLTFKRFTANHIELCLDSPDASRCVLGSGSFLERSSRVEHFFWLVESELPVTGRYEFDENSIICHASVNGSEIELRGMTPYTVIEHVIALTKKLNYMLAPDVDGKWVFGQIRLKCPLPEKARQFNIVRRHIVANRFSVNLLNVDGVDVGEVRFVVGKP